MSTKQHADRNRAKNKKTVGDLLTTSPLSGPVITGVALYVGLRIILAYAITGPSRTWGIDFTRYVIALPDVILVSLIPLVFLIPSLRRWSAQLCTKPFSGGLYPRLYWGIAVICGTLAVSLAYKFRVSFAFLGDSSYYATEIVRVIKDPQFHPAFIKPSSAFTGYALQWIARMLMPQDPYLPFRVMGFISAIVLIAGLFTFLKRESKPVAALFAAACLFGSGSMMFFSYVELYALQYTFVLLYFLAAWCAFRSNCSVILPGCMLLLSIGFGLTSLIYVPSYLLLLHWKVRGQSARMPLVTAALILAGISFLVVICGYASAGVSNAEGFLMPIGAKQGGSVPLETAAQHYTLFSFAHLLDILNVLLLNAGVFVVTIPILLITGRRDILWKEPAILFSLTAIFPAMLFLIAGNTFLGLARDWDLATIPVASVSVLVLFLLGILHREKKLHLAALTPLLVITLFSSWYVWMRVNVHILHGDRSSSERLNDIIEMDKDEILPVNTYTALENLRKFYKTERDESLVIGTIHRMVETRHNISDSYRKLLSMIAPLKDADQRAREFGRFFTSMLTYGRSAHYARLTGFEKQGIRELATVSLLQCQLTGLTHTVEESLPGFQAMFHPWKEFPLLETAGNTAMTAAEKSDRIEHTLDASTSDASLCMYAARVHKAAGRFEESVKWYEETLRREPVQLPMAYIELGQVLHLDLHDSQRALLVLDRCMRHCAGNEYGAAAARIAAKLRGQVTE